MSIVTNPKLIFLFIIVFHLFALMPLPNQAQRNQTVEGRIAAVLIDMQPIFVNRLNDREVKKEIPCILDTLDFCYQNNIPIIVLEMEDGGDTIGVLKEKLDSCGAYFLSKDDDSGFANANLEPMLKRLGADTLLLMGVNATICVKATGRDALDCGFAICTSRELIAEPRVWRPGIRTFESISWFVENGVYCNRYEDLLFVISNSDEYRDVAPQPIPVAMLF
jgi:isochorismate hydrolase